MKKGPRTVRIVYVCPEADRPIGGIKVIYKHSATLNKLGFSSAVYHPNDPAFACSWFEHEATFERQGKIDRNTDFVVVPENWAAQYCQTLIKDQIRYGIFVQNGYNLYKVGPGLTFDDIRTAYQHASLILSISEDTSRMIRLIFPLLDLDITRVYPSVDSSRFFPDWKKENVITFMPRRLGGDAALVHLGLSSRLGNDWRFVAIDNLPERGVADTLRKSRIFLSFSHMEGFGLPPLEAALCGNHVVGYVGNGGREYWIKPTFEEVSPGDIASFIERVQAAANRISTESTDAGSLSGNIGFLADKYSVRNEMHHLKSFAHEVIALF